MKRTRLAVALGSGILLAAEFATAHGAVSPATDWGWVGALSAGPGWEQAGKTQSFYLTPDIEKTYLAHRSTNTLESGEVFVGMQHELSQRIQAQIGLAFVATNDASLTGLIWDDAVPQFANHSYRYSVQHTHIALKTKLLLDTGYSVMPWVSGSAGIGFNLSHDFQNTGLIDEAVPNANFASYTQMALTYTLGVGLEKTLNDHWQVGAGYEFADWGKSRLGQAAGQTLNTGLSLNHFYTHHLLLDLTYRS